MSARVIVVALFKNIWCPAHGSAIRFCSIYIYYSHVCLVHCTYSFPCQNFILCAPLQKFKKDASCPKRFFPYCIVSIVFYSLNIFKVTKSLCNLTLFIFHGKHFCNTSLQSSNNAILFYLAFYVLVVLLYQINKISLYSDWM